MVQLQLEIGLRNLSDNLGRLIRQFSIADENLCITSVEQVLTISSFKCVYQQVNEQLEEPGAALIASQKLRLILHFSKVCLLVVILYPVAPGSSMVILYDKKIQRLLYGSLKQ